MKSSQLCTYRDFACTGSSRKAGAATFIVCMALAIPAVRGGRNGQNVVPQDRPRVAVVLSGGGARGGAHIGVLRELERAGVPIDLIVGSSYGAVIGGLYATGYSTEDLELIIRSVDWNEILSDAPNRGFLNLNNKQRDNRKLLNLDFEGLEFKLPIGLQAGQKVQQLLDRLTAQIALEADNDFDRLPIRFRAVATDILTGKPHVFRDGSISTAIRASTAIPGLFTPVELDDTLLVDGGIADNLPVDIALQHGADLVIAVDVAAPLKKRKEQFRSMIDVLNQLISLQIAEQENVNRNRASVVITPEIGDVAPIDFIQSTAVIPAGVKAAAEALPQIHRLLAARGVPLNARRKRTSVFDPSTFDLAHLNLQHKPILLQELEMDGLENYSPAFVREHISSRPHEETSIDRVDQDVSRLHGTELFRGVTYLVSRRNSGASLIFKLRENPRTRLGVGMRYDRDYKFTTMTDLIRRNFMDTGSELFFRGLVGNANRFELGLKSGTVFGSRFALSPHVRYQSRPRLVFSGREEHNQYREQRLGLGGSAAYLFSTVARVELGYRLERVDIDRGAGAFLQRLPKRLGSASAAVHFDNLDDFDFPRTGYLARLDVDWQDRVLGSEFSYLRGAVSLDRHFILSSRNSAGVAGAWGRIRGKAPFYERFYTGGFYNLSFSSIRFVGLERDQFNSQEFATFGLSFRSRLKHFRSGILKNIYWGVEYNAGVFDEDEKRRAFGPPIHGFGGGLYLETSVLGPVRLEVGRTNRGDKKTSFSLGHLF